MRSFTALLACAYYTIAYAQNIVLTNDDGWAVAQIRAEYTALVAAGFNVGNL
jgi:5'-nucleotidase